MAMKLYRFWQGSEIVYVGTTETALKDRFRQHKQLPKDAYGEITKIDFCEPPTTDDCEKLEIHLIRTYHPRYNKKHNSGNVGAWFTFTGNPEWQEFPPTKYYPFPGMMARSIAEIKQKLAELEAAGS